MRLFDSHCHLHEFLDSRIEEFTRDITIVAVSDDYPSSRRTVELASRFNNVIPCVGIHPWSVDKVPQDEFRNVEKLVENARCIGEVGLDRRFVKETYDKQREVFEAFLRLAREYDLPVNVHAPDAWRDVFNLLLKYDIDRAVIHWYTGPLDLIDDIEAAGYFISINAAIKIQEKSKRVAKEAPLKMLLVESDGPYEYRGLQLEPPMIREAIGIIAELRGSTFDAVAEAIAENFRRVFK